MIAHTNVDTINVQETFLSEGTSNDISLHGIHDPELRRCISALSLAATALEPDQKEAFHGGILFSDI